MNEYCRWTCDELVRVKDRGELEYLQAVEEVLKSVSAVVDAHPEYRRAGILERLVEPERAIMFRVPWVDDRGEIQVNRGFRVQMNSAIGPYKGGLRFHPSVNLSTIKFLAFEQTLKNALTTLPMGGGKGGSDFDPKGKSDEEVMRFCQSFMNELFRHIGPDTDVPAGDIGVGRREVGFLWSQYKRLMNEFTGALTGKGVAWGGSFVGPEAAGYGVVYIATEWLAIKNDSLAGKTCLVSGSGNVAQHTVEKLLDMEATPVTLSDSSGYIYDEGGITREKLAFVRRLKNVARGRISEYAEEYPEAVYTAVDPSLGYNPLWAHEAECAFPAATQNEINHHDAANLLAGGVRLVTEAANMPTTPEAITVLHQGGVVIIPAKAANAGGVAVSGLEMTQNSMRIGWAREEVDARLRGIMKEILHTIRDAAQRYEADDDLIAGANIVGFLKVANAMMDQGVV